MKISKLLVLSALWLAAGSAMATVVERQAPAPKATAFAEAFTEENPGSADNCYYLYNLTAARFFTQGNTWGTRACVGPYASAVKVYFTPSDAADGSYSISDYVCIRNTSYIWKGASAEAGSTNVYTDQSASWGRPYWNVIVGNDNSFRLQNIAPLGEVAGFLGRDDAVAQDFGNAYSGFTDDNQRYPISEGLTQGVGHHIDWILVAEADYVDFASVAEAFNYEVYFKSQELLVAIEEGRAKNVDVTTEEAVYSNEASTIEEMDAAIAAIKDKIIKAAEQTATPENPSDMTSAITNASYDGGAKGWSGDTPAFGNTAGEFYQKNYNHYQDVEGIPNGVYAVKVKGYFRPGFAVAAYEKWATGADLNAKLYAKAGEDSLAVSIMNIFAGSGEEPLGVGREFGENGKTQADDATQTHFIPDDMTSGEAYFNAGRYVNTVYMGTDDNKLRIGLYKNDDNIGGNWTMFDQWELSYLGNSEAAYIHWVNEAKKNVPDFSNLGETLYTASYLTTLNATVGSATGTNKAEAVAAMKAIDDAVAALEKNITLWEELVAVIADAKEVGSDVNLDPNYTSEPLADWVEFEVEGILDAHDMTNEDLEKLIAEKREAIDEARKHPIGEGVDMTNLLTNPDFSSNNWNGWTKEAASGGNVQVSNSCAEAWNNAQFDIYQVVPDAPMGVYEISVQGFYRYGRGNALKDYEAQEVDYVKESPCYVYMNAKATPFMNIFGETITDDNKADIYGSTTGYSDYTAADETHYYTPNNMTTAAKCFAFTSTVDPNSKMYTQRAYGLVAKKGDVMRVGVKGSSNQLGDSWVIFDNFKLTYQGFNKPDIIKPILDDELAKAQEKVEKLMSKDAYEHLTAAISDAETASAGADGKAMYDALVALFDVDAEVTESVNAFKDLQAKLDELNEEISIHTTSAAYDEANALMEDIFGKLESHVYTNDDVAELIAKIKEMIIKLRIPGGTPTDAAPIDFTGVIENAAYDENLNGWECVAKRVDAEGKETDVAPARNNEAGNVELFNCTYDYYQELSGLPAGIYRVQVTGFFRAGSAAEEWARKDSAEYSRAFLYAIGEEGKVSSKALARLSEHSLESSTQETGYAVVKTDTVDVESAIYNYTLLANTMAIAGDSFAQGLYGGDAVTGEGNVVTVKVGEDGKLRFGLKKSESVSASNDWTIWDDWKLWFFGPNSALVPDEDTGIASISTDKAIRIEYFTVDGRKATAAQRGIIIQRMTMPNGSVIVNKIRK